MNSGGHKRTKVQHTMLVPEKLKDDFISSLPLHCHNNSGTKSHRNEIWSQQINKQNSYFVASCLITDSICVFVKISV
jgi:hypothetical protein